MFLKKIKTYKIVTVRVATAILSAVAVLQMTHDSEPPSYTGKLKKLTKIRRIKRISCRI